MRDDYFFDGDGQPLTGKIPLQVRFKGCLLYTSDAADEQCMV